ncbi:MAG: TldD/PmbA family protein, partial [Thermoplasmata archaeon]
KLGLDYVEVRGEEFEMTNIEAIDKHINYHKRSEKGFFVRVLYKGSWGQSSTTDESKIIEALEQAYKIARASEGSVTLKEVKPVKDDVKKGLKIGDVSPEDKIELLKDIRSSILGKDVKGLVKSVRIRYRDREGRKYLMTSEGTEIAHDTDYVWRYVWVSGKMGEKSQGVRDERGDSWRGFKVLEVEYGPEKVAEVLIKRLYGQLEGRVVNPGTYDIVVAPEVVGVIAHEALGHLVEADLTMSGALANKLGQKIAPDYINIVDDGRLENGFGTELYDDEGVPTRRVEIVKNGILMEVLTNREYAHKFNLELTGNARAEDYTYPPIIRMRNTFFLPGDYSKDELFEGIKEGLYIVSFMGGEADLSSSFHVGVQEAYYIKNGEISRPVYVGAITGVALEWLWKIDALANDLDFETGRCGKGQEALVSSGGPHIRVRGVKLG